MAIVTLAFTQPRQPRQCHVDLILSNPPGSREGFHYCSLSQRNWKVRGVE